MDIFFFYITWLGSILILLPTTVLVSAVFRRVIHLTDMCLILGGLLGSSLLAHVLKLLISRPRPTVVKDMLVTMPTDFSFPSAHTAQATAFFIALALVTSRGLEAKIGLIVWVLCGLVIVAVGLSRVYLRVHYISDVIAGAALGLVWVHLLNHLIRAMFSGGGHA